MSYQEKRLMELMRDFQVGGSKVVDDLSLLLSEIQKRDRVLAKLKKEARGAHPHTAASRLVKKLFTEAEG